MKTYSLLTHTLLFLFACASVVKGIDKNDSVEVKNVVISEKAYQSLIDPTLNLNKLAKIADRKNGIRRIKDDPYARVRFSEFMLRDPRTGKVPENFRKMELQFVEANKSKLQSRLKSKQLNWVRRGPYNVGGRTRALAIDKTNKDIILAGGVSGGMWRSTDAGQTWTKTTLSTELQSVTAIAQDPRPGKTNIWYYTTGELTGNSARGPGAPYRGNGIYKSTDGGLTWNSLPATASNTPQTFDNHFDYCWNITVDPTSGDIYVATIAGIYRSRNEGATWGEMVLDSRAGTTNSSDYTDIVCTSNGVKYATLSSDGKISGIYRSVSGDKGDWTDITPENFPAIFNRIVIGDSPSHPYIVYFLGQTPDAGFQGHSLWRLTWDDDNGALWDDLSVNLPQASEGESSVDGYRSQNSYNMVIKVAPKDTNMVFIGGTNLFRNNNGFYNPESTKWIGGNSTANDVTFYPNQHPDQHALVFKNDTTLISGHDGGLSITYNFKANNTEEEPVKWEFLNNGYYTTQAFTVAIDEDDNSSNEILSGFQDNGTWYTFQNTSPNNWLEVYGGDGSYCSIHNSKKSGIVSAQLGYTYIKLTDDNGNVRGWARIDPEGTTDGDMLFINPFVVDASNENVMYFAGGEYIWRNKNIYEIPLFSNNKATKNWEKLEQTSVPLQKISALETTMNPENILLYGTSKGEIYKMTNATSDQAVPVNITGDNMPKDAYVRSIETDPLDANKILVSFSNYKVHSIFYSDNGGASWTKVGGNLEEYPDGSGNGPSVRWANMVHTPTGMLYLAGTSTGLYSTTELNGDATVWTQENPETIGNSIVSMVKTRKDGLIVIGTHGNGVFSAKVNFSAVKPQADFVADRIIVAPNTPVNFKDRSIGVVSTRNWTFEGAVTTSFTDVNPQSIIYEEEGTYSVTLTAGNDQGNSTITKTDYIIVQSDDLVGIDELVTLQEPGAINIYPNPMEEESEIRFPNSNHTQYRLIVVDASGKVVRIIENINKDNFIIRRGKLKQGLHIVNLQGEKIYQGKLLVK